jgi:hypothetical protein
VEAAIDVHDREVHLPVGGRHAHERARVSAAVAPDGGHAVALGDDEVEDVLAVGETIAESLAEGQETGPVECGGTEDSGLERRCDASKSSQRPLIEGLVEGHHGLLWGRPSEDPQWDHGRVLCAADEECGRPPVPAAVPAREMSVVW